MIVVPSSVVILVGVIETLEEDEDTRNDTSNIQERVWKGTGNPEINAGRTQ